ncbi:MAG: hypothetical protein ACLQQ0_00820 [Limisphaerales bacterium]
MNSMAVEATTLGRRVVDYLKRKPGMVWRILPGLLLWFSFIKLPTTTSRGWGSQSWEAVLSFAAAHHLQWGQDIVFTYGPLGFLTSDYYWGNHFWPILLWSFAFSLLLTTLLLRFSGRVILPVRIVLYAGLPWLTMPHSLDLGIDPLCLFAITLAGVACLPEERPGIPLLMAAGLILGLSSLIKFTFCLYAIFALATISVAYLIRRCLWPAEVVLGSALASFLAAWWLTGQNIFHIGLWFRYSLQIASGYSAAMSFAPFDSDLVLGILIWLCLMGMLLIHGCGSTDRWRQTPKVCLLVTGIFLAWKEGFVRADNVHVMVFLVYASLMSATMPALLGVSEKRRLLFLPLTAVTVLFALAPLTMRESAFVVAMKTNAAPKLTDTFTALFRPVEFKHRLEANLESRRSLVLLPRVAAIVGNAPVGVLNTDQDVAILNGFNYRPQPVFLCYSAYTPELQRLNSEFFDSAAAPEYVLWRYGTMDVRFPTLDDGRMILTLLNGYSPLTKEGDCILWKRNVLRGPGYSFAERNNVEGLLDQWLPIPAQATWMKIELHETWHEAVQKFFCRASMPAMEIRLEDGRTMKYRLVPGMAQSGFVINPLLDSETDLLRPFLKEGKPVRVTAVRVYSKKWCFDDSVHFVLEKIEGIPALQCGPDSSDPPVVSAPPSATAP